MPNSDFVQVALDGTGKKIDTAVQTSDATGAPTVERQGVFLGDPTTFANKAKVDDSGNLATAVPDGANVTQGATSDTSSANTVVGLLKAVKALLTGTLTTSVSNFPGTQPVSGSVSVDNLPGTQPVSGTVTANAGSGTLATSVADGQNAAVGTTTDLSSASTLVGLLKNIKAALAGTLTTTVSNFPATQPVSGTVTANAGTGTLATSVADGSNVAIGTTTDASSASTLVGLLKNIKAALAGTLTISGAVTNSNLDVALSTRLKPADTLAGVTTVAAVTAITNPLPAGTNTIGSVKQATQSSLTATLCSALTGTGAQAGQSLDGYDGAGTLQITAVGTVGAQAVSLQIEGSIDNSNWGIVGTAQIDATANPSYAAASFTITPGASTVSHLYAVRDTVKFLRVNVTANNLGTGLTVSYYSNPV